jgi:hypothetical protein
MKPYLWSEVLLEKVIIPQLVEIIMAYYEV